jgi:hypothetical protein
MRMIKISTVKVPLRFDPTWVMYLIVVDGVLTKNPFLEKTKPTEKFFDMINRHVTSYITEGKLPPEQIASAVFNIADDVMGNRQVTVRAGDYISLMEFARANKQI